MGQMKRVLIEQSGAVPVCQTCGSENVVKDASVSWDSQTGKWVIDTVIDQAFCKACEADTTLRWTLSREPLEKQIQALNDEFRIHGRGNGSIMMTSGVQALGVGNANDIMAAVRAFDDFTEDNDPHGEHDFGAIDIVGEKVFWKIDQYDLSMTKHSPNPCDPAVTRRVLTVMLASEY